MLNTTYNLQVICTTLALIRRIISFKEADITIIKNAFSIIYRIIEQPISANTDKDFEDNEERDSSVDMNEHAIYQSYISASYVTDL